MAVKRRLVLRIAGAAVVLAVLVPGYLWLHGDFRRWDDEAKLDAACDGLLDRAAIREVLGDGDVGVREWDGPAHQVRCEVVVEGGGRVEVRVADETVIGSSVSDLYVYRGTGRATPSVPVGGGWSGLFGARPRGVDGEDFDDVTTALTLRCTAGDAKSLMVAVETDPAEAGPLDDPANRPAYARIAETTARKASDVRGCDAEPGRKVRSLRLPVSQDEYKPLAEADGTCAGIEPVSGVRSALETARDGAPYEVCLLNGPDGSRRYELAAAFGPYALLEFEENRTYGAQDRPVGDVPARNRKRADQSGWTTAKCPDGTAVFTLLAVGRHEDKGSAFVSGDLAQERAVLKVFAERSAGAHGCQAPATP
ncbi:hypothetical protein H9Y04_02390 [Streptomyces sp. TRM66268-LWL]|uniref:DUF4333 domain-containing protein n=1 Tax=Streptomyces polyasparticus TaxID=2767826 RepID=A0ABR7S7H7_9ACTN|nr:hypothetical protein [Streptomyces polyasparticus]MBC9711420.1 hypothetical protein [Streptomyces polyasparticus]